MKNQLIWVFEWRKSVHYWWSYILFSPECKELTSMLDPLLYRWGTADLDYTSGHSHRNVTGLKIQIHNFFEFETWLHPLSRYVAVGFLFAQLERLWNGLHTAFGTDHELFHSLNIYNTNLNFELFYFIFFFNFFFFFLGGAQIWLSGPNFYILTIVAPMNF